MRSSLNPARAAEVLFNGTLASVFSAAVLAWRGRAENASAAAPLNAPAQWLHGRESLHRNDASWRHTATGMLIHHVSAVFWAVFYQVLQMRRHTPTPASALRDATIVTAVAAVVDLKLVPQRLTPGFQRRLSRPSVTLVYAAFAAGLALGACLQRR